MDPTVIQIGSFEAFVTVVATLFAIGAGWGTLKRSVSNIERLLHSEVVPELRDVRERFVVVEGRVEQMWDELRDVRERFMVVEDRVDRIWNNRILPAQSPRRLNEAGLKILHESGVQDFVDARKEELFSKIRAQQFSNPYDAEQFIIDLLKEVPDTHPEVMDRLKTGAFETGTDIGSVLLVGSIYLRDLIFPELGFSIDGEGATSPLLTD